MPGTNQAKQFLSKTIDEKDGKVNFENAEPSFDRTQSYQLPNGVSQKPLRKDTLSPPKNIRSNQDILDLSFNESKTKKPIGLVPPMKKQLTYLYTQEDDYDRLSSIDKERSVKSKSKSHKYNPSSPIKSGGKQGIKIGCIL